VTEGVATRTHMARKNWVVPNKKTTKTAKLFHEIGKPAKSTAETGVIWGRLPPSRGSGEGLQRRFGISARHLPLLIGRLS